MPARADTPTDLPGPIAAYFAGDGTDAGDVAPCFTENAVVIDERRAYQGQHAIAKWKAEAATNYHYTSEPLTVDRSGEDVEVVARLTGEFQGSPIELRYRFTLTGDKIARLEIMA